MAVTQIIRSVMLASAVLLIAACASQPVSSPAYAEASTPLLEKKFQQAAQHYRKYRYEGQTVYCRKEKVITSAIPVVQCLNEAQLRQQVASYERGRNPVARPLMPGAGQGGIG
jgi:hypothetical protein